MVGQSTSEGEIAQAPVGLRLRPGIRYTPRIGWFGHLPPCGLLLLLYSPIRCHFSLEAFLELRRLWQMAEAVRRNSFLVKIGVGRFHCASLSTPSVPYCDEVTSDSYSSIA